MVFSINKFSWVYFRAISLIQGRDSRCAFGTIECCAHLSVQKVSRDSCAKTVAWLSCSGSPVGSNPLVVIIWGTVMVLPSAAGDWRCLS